MSRSIFGWSYPPGCSGPPDDPEFCEVCGNDVDSCVCPECKVCGEVGRPSCYKDHGMVMDVQQLTAKVAADKRQKEEEERWERRAEEELEGDAAEERWEESFKDMREEERVEREEFDER